MAALVLNGGAINFELNTPATSDKIVITGGAGFIGSAVCRQLRARGNDVVAIVRDPDRAATAVADRRDRCPPRRPAAAGRSPCGFEARSP